MLPEIHPILRYKVGTRPDYPTIAVIEILTPAGAHLYMATREILESLGNALLTQSASLLHKDDLS